ncbi:hypothetical protein MJO48_17145 [Dickeya fangzhongdai]|uniref:hypothetical protein n=1 Tax=Dickeya fangzhongdai TaxID=1778540 RepID=UPI001EFA9E3E|nr:hypothetical protein [Dickeya fangzhongdai]ULR30167.1 hypothetical protein MJO48_17145 [Dickeya fangzhongdai]
MTITAEKKTENPTHENNPYRHYHQKTKSPSKDGPNKNENRKKIPYSITWHGSQLTLSKSVTDIRQPALAAVIILLFL